MEQNSQISFQNYWLTGRLISVSHIKYLHGILYSVYIARILSKYEVNIKTGRLSVLTFLNHQFGPSGSLIILALFPHGSFGSGYLWLNSIFPNFCFSIRYFMVRCIWFLWRGQKDGDLRGRHLIKICMWRTMGT